MLLVFGFFEKKQFLFLKLIPLNTICSFYGGELNTNQFYMMGFFNLQKRKKEKKERERGGLKELDLYA